MTDIKTIEKIVAVLDVLSNTVSNLVKSTEILTEQVTELRDERLLVRVHDLEREVRDVRRTVDRFDIG